MSPLSPSQGFIWAVNTKQQVEPTADADLEFHTTFGRFSADLAANKVKVSDGSQGEMSVPIIKDWGITRDILGREKKDGSAGNLKVAVAIHGILLSAAFLLVIPTGIVAITLGGPRAFATHWRVQVAGLWMTVVGGVVGVLFSMRFSTFKNMGYRHQIVGLVIVGLALLQVALGWRHHVIFKKFHGKTVFSFLHVWLGRFLVMAGMMNVGMLVTSQDVW